MNKFLIMAIAGSAWFYVGAACTRIYMESEEYKLEKAEARAKKLAEKLAELDKR